MINNTYKYILSDIKNLRGIGIKTSKILKKKGINNFVDTVLVNNLINVLEADNPNFSRGRFLIAINDTEQV